MFRVLTTAVALALSSQLAHASPFTPPAAELATLASTFPVRTLEGEFVHPNVTINENGARALVARQEFPASLLLCQAANCAACTAFNLATIPENECFTTSAGFISVAISQTSGQGLPLVVGVGPPGCASFLTLPQVNTCFNINGGVFDDFVVLP